LTKLEVRASVPEDAPAITQLCQRLLSVPEGSPMFEPALLAWKYWRPWPTWPSARSHVVTRGAELLAHIAAIPVTYRSGGETWTLLHPLDWAASSEVVGVGAMLLSRLSKLADGLLVVGGSAMTQRMLAPLGFRPLPEVGRFAARPCAGAPAGVAVRELAADEVPVLEEIFAPGLVALRSPALHSLWAECPALSGIVARAVLGAGAAIGGFLLGLVPGQARILDVWCASPDPADWARVLLAARFEAARHPGAAEVVMLANTSLERDALLRAGFEPCGGVQMHLLSRRLAPHAELGLRFQLLDGDAAFLHRGSPESWLGSQS
jgi:hypothetical protein